MSLEVVGCFYLWPFDQLTLARKPCYRLDWESGGHCRKERLSGAVYVEEGFEY